MSAGWRGWMAPWPRAVKEARRAPEETSRRAPRAVKTAQGTQPARWWCREESGPSPRPQRVEAALICSPV
eukprot:8358398-Alexandrium_andersonii.AAC.1